MTLIEFFDKDAIENVCSSLAGNPERVIFLGDRRKLMEKHAERYRAVLSARGAEPEILCRTVNKNKMQAIVDALSGIVEEYDDCVFDLTGGDDLYLVAGGIIFEKYRDRGVQMHRFNLWNNSILDCDQDGQTILTEAAPVLTVDENIRIYGGDVVYEKDRPAPSSADWTRCWDMSSDFREDILALWKISKGNPRLWNTQIGFLKIADQFRGSDPLEVDVATPYLRDAVSRSGGDYTVIRGIFKELCRAGLLRSCSIGDERFSVSYKNEQVKRCLTVEGQVLELRIYLAALEATENDGSLTYNDVMTGVTIDWDGNIHEEENTYDTENEIDVLLIHGTIPVFVSCKNGGVDKDELYKLNAVAARFGGKYAKKVLVATSLDDSAASNYLRQRAADMGIRLVEGYSHNGSYRNLTEMSDAELNRVVRSFWSN